MIFKKGNKKLKENAWYTEQTNIIWFQQYETIRSFGESIYTDTTK